MNGDDEGNWQDQQSVIVAAGVAGLLLVALLVWAVIHTAAGNSSRPPEPAEFAPSSAISSTYTTSSTSSTSYSMPSVQTSQDNPVITGPTGATPPGNSADDETMTSTTAGNPYPTTTPTNAGHI